MIYIKPSFDRLYKKEINALYNFVAWRVSSQQDAEDIVSTVFLSAYEAYEQFRPSSQISTRAWLFVIARRKLIDHYRTTHNKKHVPLEEASWLPDTVQPHISKTMDLAIFVSELKKQIETLPEIQRETISLVLFAQMKHKDIAQIFGVSQKTVASNIVRAKEKLRPYLIYWNN